MKTPYKPTNLNHVDIHALTFDVEAWFHAANLGVPRRQWDSLPMRLDEPIDFVLNQLAGRNVRATFFVLGYVAQREPALVRRIHNAGHEIASHGYFHEPITQLDRESFVEDTRLSKDTLEELIGESVIGYRAPSYSVTATTLWALELLADIGFVYDSSIYPTRSPDGRYGLPGSPLTPFFVSHRFLIVSRSGHRRERDTPTLEKDTSSNSDRGSSLLEFPLPVFQGLGCRIPAATGAYLRLGPMALTRWTLHQYARRKAPAVVNLHPWEFDVHQPRWATTWSHRWRHYGRLRSTRSKLVKLLDRYRFASLCSLATVAKPTSLALTSKTKPSLVVGSLASPESQPVWPITP